MLRGMKTPAWTLNLVSPHLRVGRKEEEREKERVGERYIVEGREGEWVGGKEGGRLGGWEGSW